MVVFFPSGSTDACGYLDWPDNNRLCHARSRSRNDPALGATSVTLGVSRLYCLPPKSARPQRVRQLVVANRRYLGLSFAAGFGWQAAFIGVMLARHNNYYWEELHNDHDLFLRMISYVFLTAMTVTSFFPVRRRMHREHWRYLHLAGIWFFWAAIWVSYAGQAASAGARTIDLIYTTLGLLTLSLRLVAYQRTRSRGLVSP